MVRRNERHILVTDHGKRAELREQRRKKLNSWLVWGLSQSGRDRETGQAYIRGYPTALVSAAVPVRWTTKNSCSLWCSRLKSNKKKLRANFVLNNKEAPTHHTTNTCSCDCEVRATVPSETTVSRESRHDSKQLCNSERNQSDRDTRASTTFNGVVRAAVPHVLDVRTISRFSKCSINQTQTTGKKNHTEMGSNCVSKHYRFQ